MGGWNPHGPPIASVTRSPGGKSPKTPRNKSPRPRKKPALGLLTGSPRGSPRPGASESPHRLCGQLGARGPCGRRWGTCPYHPLPHGGEDVTPSRVDAIGSLPVKDVGVGWDILGGDLGMTKELSPSALKEIPETELGDFSEAGITEMDITHLFSFDSMT